MNGSMSCQELVELVTEFLEGALDEVTEQRVRNHLAECRGCDAYVEQFRTTVSGLRRIPAESLSAPGRERLLDAFRDWHQH